MEINYDKYPLPKRLRHHTSPNLYFKYSDMKKIPNYYPPLIERLDWKDLFINGARPDILDIGCGKGSFLLNMSDQHPDNNILGVELRKQAVDWINRVVAGEDIKNCAAIWYSVVNGLKFIESKSIDKIFYLFPDPWPKRKHLKRRVFSSEFIEECYRILKDGGGLYLATDLEEINTYHMNILNETDKFNYRQLGYGEQWHFPLTNKEKFCISKNIPVYKLVCSIR